MIFSTIYENFGWESDNLILTLDLRLYLYIAAMYLRDASIEEFTDFIEKLSDDVRELNHVIIAGDFKAWAVE